MFYASTSLPSPPFIQQQNNPGMIWSVWCINSSTFPDFFPSLAFFSVTISLPFTLELNIKFSSVQLLSRVWLFVTPWIAACQAFLSITNSQSLLKLMPIKSVMPSSHLILCLPFLLLPPIPPSIRVFSNESTLRLWWPKYWSFSFSISPSNEHPGLISFRMDWLDLPAVQGTLKSLLQHHSSKGSIFLALSFLYNPTLTSTHDHWKNHSLDQMDLCWQSLCFLICYLGWS